MRIIRFIKKNLTLLFFVFLFISQNVSGQWPGLFCGNREDDMYLRCYSMDGMKHLRITDYGERIALLGPAPPYYDYTEPIEGLFFSHFEDMGHFFLKSVDHAKTWTQISSVNFLIYWVYGGAIPGECIVTRDFTNYSGSRMQILKSYNNGANYILVKDSANIGGPGFMGYTSGEFYTKKELNDLYIILHSYDFAKSFDTIPIDINICSPTTNGEHLYGLYRGASQDELYIVTNNASCPTTYKFYHSSDIGNSWTFMNSVEIPCGIVNEFCAGRGACTFYYIYYEIQSGEYTNLHLNRSMDCGATFTEYTYILTDNVSIKGLNSSIASLVVSSNPCQDHASFNLKVADAGTYNLRLFSEVGVCVSTLLSNVFIQAEQSLSLSTQNLSPGVYFAVLSKDREVQIVKKAIIVK